MKTRNDREPELKPCPFCGSGDISIDIHCGWFAVECDECDAAGPVCGFEYDEDNRPVGAKEARALSVELWNIRR